jgi:hypothetical protein
MVKDKRPSLVFLMETKVTSKKVCFLPMKLGMENKFVVDCRGKSGGLILLWKSSALVEIQNFSCGHINAVVKVSKCGIPWELSCFYGHPEVQLRPQSWSLLRHLASLAPNPWLCLGNFNEIVSSTEKSSHTVRPQGQMAAFQKVLDDCRLLDLGFTGPKYTWCNGRLGNGITRERLDRAVANIEWSGIFDMVSVEVLPQTKYDHNPLLVFFSKNNELTWRKWRQFRYEASWEKHREYS